MSSELTSKAVACIQRMSCMRCFCSCIWGNPDPGPVRLRDVQQVVLDTNRMGTVVSVCLSSCVVCTAISLFRNDTVGVYEIHTVTFVTMARLGRHQGINLGQLSLSIPSRCQCG